MAGRAIHRMMIKSFEEKQDKARYRKGNEKKIRIGDCHCAVGSNSSPLLGPHLETP